MAARVVDRQEVLGVLMRFMSVVFHVCTEAQRRGITSHMLAASSFVEERVEAYQAYRRATAPGFSDASEDDEDGDMCDESSVSDCSDETLAQLIDMISKVSRTIKDVGLGRLWKRSLDAALRGIIGAHLSVPHMRVLERHTLGGLLRWVSTAVVTWASMMQPDSADEVARQTYDTALAIFSDLRISELFSIIVEYPDSQPAVEDLRFGLEHQNKRKQLATSLRAAIQARLLHPGACTNDILTHYIATIRCLRVLDPSHIALNIVVPPIRDYLRQREDTVRCIVAAMVSDESDLFEDLVSGGMLTLDDSEDEDEDFDDPEWRPLPVDAKGVFKSAEKRNADVINSLVSIFNTKDVFVKEIERLFATRLLKAHDYNPEKEESRDAFALSLSRPDIRCWPVACLVRQLEVLKLRFGGESLQRCEVMLKDIAGSRRINQHIRESSRAEVSAITRHPLFLPLWPSKGRCVYAYVRTARK
ncbi:Anaphase-promoting complex subunit 2 [Spiromyces aspiralis]|uniref:Anaphase-promoting complex subunit 2 n=1 Tax=Spiromyces aspiralis TaxID=68401 RepID=A0ACC1HCW2_9FUNG|nr:Anaphase-promoting complex subunit 2 [Spiromyces aspiralis]